MKTLIDARRRLTARLHSDKEALLLFGLMLRRTTAPDIADTMLCDYAAELIKQAKILQRIAVAQCERSLTTHEEKAEVRAITLINTIVFDLWGPDCRKAECNAGDPRGASVKLFPPDGSVNSWDGESYAVPLV